MVVNIAEISAYYQTVVTAVTMTVPGWQLLLKADPTRYNLRIERYPGALGEPFVVPTKALPTLANPTASNLPRESKWSEKVCETTGEWYVFATGTETIILIEILQLSG